MQQTHRRLTGFVDRGTSGIFLLVGQAGSGKTTNLMDALYEMSSNEKYRVFQFEGDCAEDLEDALTSTTTHPEQDAKTIFWMPDFQLYASEIEKISRLATAKNAVVVGELRSSDWSGRFFGKHKEAAEVVVLHKLLEEDYTILADAIQEFATAPDFRKMDRNQQVKLLKGSRNQLLILMMEATRQRPFEEIIEHEYSSLPDDDAQAFLCIVGLITLSRSRLSVSDYSTITSMFGLRTSLATCLAQLDGIVEITSGNTIIGRHESYVSHILSKAADLQTVYDACLAILRSFTVYKEPFVLTAGKVKGNILKFMMRGTFLLSIFRGNHKQVEQLYEELEYDYQNDGHYWLQRGKFFRSLGDINNQKMALAYFTRSVEAYDNSYARHSLAQQKLIFCGQFNRPSPHLETLMDEGVTELRRQMIIRQDAEDEYPVVALARSHPAALLAWGRVKEAKLVAGDYLRMLQELDKRMPHKDKEISSAILYCVQISAS